MMYHKLLLVMCVGVSFMAVQAMWRSAAVGLVLVHSAADAHMLSQNESLEIGTCSIDSHAYLDAQDAAYTERIRRLFTMNDELTLLHVACDPDMTKSLLAQKASVHVVDHEGWTPLMYAVFRGQSEQVQLLLEHKADAYAEDHEGFTPLDMALRPVLGTAHDGYAKTMLVLQQYGDVSWFDWFRLHIARLSIVVATDE